MSWKRSVAGAGVLFAVIAGLLAAMWPGLSAASGGGETPVSVTYSTTGETPFTVPANVFQLNVTAVGGNGASGGSNSNGSTGGSGGAGASVTATGLGVTPGETLYVGVGGNASGASGGGGPAPGGNGGGGGSGDAGGGGGASLITTCSQADEGISCGACPPFLANCYPALDALIVAAGGGGGGGPADSGASEGGGCGTCAANVANGGNGGVQGADGTAGAVSTSAEGLFLSSAGGGQAGAQSYSENGGGGGSGPNSCGSAISGQNGSELGGSGGSGGSDDSSCYSLGESGGVGGGGGGGRFGGGGGGTGGFEAHSAPYSGWGGGGGGGGGSSYVVGATADQLAADTTTSSAGTPSVTISYTLPGPAAAVAVSVRPASLVADGTSSASVTATVTDAEGQPIPGEQVAFQSTDPGQQLGPVTDNGNGTYTATLTASTKPGAAIITATDAATGASGSATLAETIGPPQRVQVALAPSQLLADGTATTLATATVTDQFGNAEPGGETVSFASSDSGDQVGPVTDHGNGVYTAVITASRTPGVATITATDQTDGITGQARLTQTPVPAATSTTASSAPSTGTTSTPSGSQPPPPLRISSAGISSHLLVWRPGPGTSGWPKAKLRFKANRATTVRLLLQARKHGRFTTVAVSFLHAHRGSNAVRIAGRWHDRLLPARQDRLVVQVRRDGRWQTVKTFLLTVRHAPGWHRR